MYSCMYVYVFACVYTKSPVYVYICMYYACTRMYSFVSSVNLARFNRAKRGNPISDLSSALAIMCTVFC